MGFGFRGGCGGVLPVVALSEWIAGRGTVAAYSDGPSTGLPLVAPTECIGMG